MKIYSTLGLLSSALLIGGCTKDLTTPDGGVNPPPTGDRIKHMEGADGTIATAVNASNVDDWVYLDLETREERDITTPRTSNDWDVAFRRFRIITNGGVSGNGGAEVAVLEGASFDELEEAPGDGYVQDAADGDDEGEIPDDAIRIGPTSETGPWAYDVETHQLSGSDAVFVVKSVEGNFYKVQFTEYYDMDGSPGHIELLWKKLEKQKEPLGPDELLVTWDRGYSYVSIENGAVNIDTPETSLDWDLGVRFVGWQSNGGEDRGGNAGALLATTADFDSITSAPTIGYAQDSVIPYPGPPGSPDFSGNPTMTEWFEYDMTGHIAAPLDLVFLIRGARGNYGKLKVLEYDEPNKTYKIRLAPVTRTVDTITATIDAKDNASWVYMSVRLGKEVMVTNSSMDSRWDIAFSRTKIRTNSGTSGTGSAGGNGPINMSLDAITTAPVDNYLPDTLLVDPSTGSMYSGNSILSDWWTFDGTSSSTVPKDSSYAVRAADGSYAKMRITGYANDGEYTVDIAYAGPDETDF